jgi:isopenicillin-N epimerase
LLQKRKIEVPVNPWPAFPKRLLRISAQLYNSAKQYEILADALRQRFPRHNKMTNYIMTNQ